MRYFFIFYFVLGVLFSADAQEFMVLDRVVAVVGNKIILQSDIDAQYTEYIRQQNIADENTKCGILQNQIVEKLLLIQAEADSLTVSDQEIDRNINQKIQYFTQQMGSVEKLEKDLLGKSVLQFKQEIRPQVREQLLSNKMQQQVVAYTTITPAEVQTFFHKIPIDSLPLFNTEVEIGEIVKYPPISKEQKDVSRTKLEALRARIRAGEDFGTLAMLYSEDPGSAAQNGDLGFFGKGMMVGPFEAAAFKLKPGEISPIVETKFGFHIIKLTERKGDQIRASHILIKTNYSPRDLGKTRAVLDSAIVEINTGRMTFGEAAFKYSDNEESKSSGGMLRNPADMSFYIPFSLLGQIDPSLPAVVDTMKAGQLSQPLIYINQRESKQGFRVVYLKSISEPHRANLEQDYARIQEAAIQEKNAEVFDKWIDKTRKLTYIRIDPDYEACSDLKGWNNAMKYTEIVD